MKAPKNREELEAEACKRMQRIGLPTHYGVVFTTTTYEGVSADEMTQKIEWALRNAGIRFGPVCLSKRR